jgi:hypothetical protein
VGPEKSSLRTTGSSGTENGTTQLGGCEVRKAAEAKARQSADSEPRRRAGIMGMPKFHGRPTQTAWKRTQNEAGYGRQGADQSNHAV